METACERCGQVHGVRRCTAHKKRHNPDETLEPCHNWKALGTEVCRMHGAKSLRGPANPNFKRGKFSDVLPEGWATQAERMAADPTLLELREHVALVDTMIREELRRLGDAERPDVGVYAAKRAMSALDRATASRNGVAAQAAYAKLKEAIREVELQERSRAELHRLLDQRRRLVETEHRRIERMKAFVTAEQLTVLAYRFVDLGAEMMDTLALEVTRLVNQRRLQVRQLVIAELERLGLPLASEAIGHLAAQVSEQLDVAGEVHAASSRSLSDFAARLQEIGEAEGASNVELDELPN